MFERNSDEMYRNIIWPRCLQLVLLLILCTWTIKSCGQDSTYKAILQDLTGEIPEESDLSELEETFIWFGKHPIDLNNTSPETLGRLIFLSPLQIEKFFKYLATNGKLIDLLELQSVPLFDVKTIGRLLPFVTLNTSQPFRIDQVGMLRKQAEQELLLRYGRVLEHQKGYATLPGSHYEGNPGKALFKYRLQIKDLLSASFVAEKDAGELIFTHKSAFDFQSGHIAYTGRSFLKQVLLGDYSLQFGQGLTLWSGFGYGKGADVTTLSKSDVGLKPYTSSNENTFLRGTAISLRLFKPLVWTVFASRLKQDASLREQDDGTMAQITISESGLHRTASERKNKDVLTQTVLGNSLQYRSDKFEVGLVAYQSQYNHPFITGPALYNQFNFTGNTLHNAGLSYSYTFGNLYLYGETAKSYPGGWSTINGVLASFSKKFSLAVVNRHYATDYYSFISRSLGENTDARNERGWYVGLNYQFRSNWLLSAGIDLFAFPSAKYRIDSASRGYEHLFQITYTPNKFFKLIGRAKMDSKAQNSDDARREDIDQIHRQNYRLGINWQVNRDLGLEGRIELVRYSKAEVDENGFLVYQDLGYKVARKFKFNTRIAFFRTDSYNSRLYAYEDDVLYSSGFGLYQDKGVRSYLNVGYNPLKKLFIYLRYAITVYPGATTVGSALDVISGNKKSEFKLQLRLQF